YLVSPAGEPLDAQATGGGQAIQFTLRKPQAGRWTAILRVFNGVDGAHLHEPFTGRIGFDAAQVNTIGVPRPTRTVLTAGVPVTAAVVVTNTGLTSKDYFVDPRLNQTQVMPLLSSGFTNVPLPLTTRPNFLVPTATDRIIVAAQGSAPITMSIQ